MNLPEAPVPWLLPETGWAVLSVAIMTTLACGVLFARSPADAGDGRAVGRPVDVRVVGAAPTAR